MGCTKVRIHDAGNYRTHEIIKQKNYRTMKNYGIWQIIDRVKPLEGENTISWLSLTGCRIRIGTAVVDHGC